MIKIGMILNLLYGFTSFVDVKSCIEIIQFCVDDGGCLLAVTNFVLSRLMEFKPKLIEADNELANMYITKE